MARPIEVEFYDVRSYADWNWIQNIIESEKQWAITYIHQFGNQEEMWEAWADGELFASRCRTIEEAQAAIRAAKKEHNVN